MRIGLDIDECIAGFWDSYCKKFTNPRDLSQVFITRNLHKKLRKDKNFWVNLPVINRPTFNPTLYCTKRINSKEYTKQFLIKNNLPLAPIYQVFTHNGRKSKKIKGRVDVFIDDSIDNFLEINKAGIPCLLFNTDNNIHFYTCSRIYELDYNVILDKYKEFIENEFSYYNNNRCLK